MADNDDKFVVRWGTKDDPHTQSTECRMKYWINCTGLVMEPWGTADAINKAVKIEMFNSRGEIAMGHIKIPHAKIPEVIRMLDKFYYEGFQK